MNILFTSDLSGMGGGETSLLNICSVLKETNNIFALCAQRGTLVDLLEQMGIKTFVFDYRNKKRLPLTLLKIRRIVKENKIECIHNNDPLTSVITWFSVFGLRRDNYWTCHGQWYDFGVIKKYLIKKANKHIFCVSTKVKENLSRMGMLQTSVTYLGIPLEKYSNSIALNSFRKANGFDYNEIIIGAIGRFQPIKGQLKLIKAFEKVNKKIERTRLVLVGGCIYNNAEERAYYNKCLDFVSENNLSEKVIFLGERKNIPEILKSFDVLVIPSDNESFGMVAIEAMAAGIPVLSTPNDGVSEILEYKPELIAKTNDVDGLYDLMIKFFDKKTDMESIRSFLERRSKRFDIEEIVLKYMNVFKNKA